MTNASQSVRVVTEHRFTVPCEEPWGGDMKDLGVAMTWARNKATELGIDTGTDDWARLHVGDDELIIVVREVEDE